MSKRILITTKFKDKYQTFLEYCTDAGKIFVDELSEADFIAYRAKYFASREEIENIKKIVASKSAEINLFDESEFDLFAEKTDSKTIQTLREIFNIVALEPYKNILVTELPFNNRVQNLLKRENCFTLGELLNYSVPELSALKNFGRGSIDNVIKVLEKIFLKSMCVARTTPEESKKNFETPELLDKDSLKNFAEEMVCSVLKNKKQIAIIAGRVVGKTLKEIGKELNITRERVRQIENSAIKNFSQYSGLKLKKFFDSVCELLGEKNFVTFEDLKNFIGEDSTKTLWFFISKIASDKKVFCFDAATNTIIFTANKKMIDYDKLIDSLPKILSESELQEEINQIVKEKNCSEELLRLKILQIYKHSGKFFYRGFLTLRFQCGYILREIFQSGYKIADETHYNRFVRYLREIFGYENAISQRALDAILSRIGVLCGRGKYMHPDFLHVPQKIILLINDYIEKSERTVLPYKEIFTALKENFVGTQITNQYILQGAIKYCGSPYTLSRDCLTKNADLNLAAEFNNFVAKNGEVSTQEIKAEFISFQVHNIGMLLQRCPEIICIGKGKYLHSTRLNLQEDESAEIEKFLQNICENKPASSRYLYNLFWERFQDFLYRNKIEDAEKLFGILKYMFGKKFNFSRPYISTTNIAGITNKKILLQYIEDRAEVEIEDILNLCEEQGIKYLSKSTLIENLNPEFIRVDEFYLRRPESIGITDEIIEAVVENVKLAMERNGGWQSAKTFPDFEWLPRLEVSWNSFLLESIVKLSADNFKILHSFSTAGEFSTAVFVSENFAEDDFNSFCLKILIEEQERDPFQNKDEILNWLKDKGLAHKKLPKAIDEYDKIHLK
ncbi:MAG: hypothetical protein IJT73_11235 [Selenomonadaceae bacterium]|nr:hypothetical protein [Selenomonadaceae bacterium]